MRTTAASNLLERKLVHHCSPTLAGLKPANLFVCREGIERDDNPRMRTQNSRLNSGSSALAPKPCRFARELAACRAKLEPCGVRIEVLARRKTGLLLYVYRPTMLKASLSQPNIAQYLQSEGYNPADLSACILKLHRRICGTDLAAMMGREETLQRVKDALEKL